MSRYFLSSVKVEGFRGINNETAPLELRFRHDAVNSVFAPNGVGKSSLFEALCYAIRGTVPKLSILQAQEKPDQYVCNRFHSQNTATIDLEFLSDDPTPATVSISVKRLANGTRSVTSSSGHTNPEAFLAQLDHDFTLLDYRTFEHFIDSTPLQRGRSFSALLGLAAYSDFRQMLQSLCDTRSLNSELEIATLSTRLKSISEMNQAAIRKLGASYTALTGKTLTDVGAAEASASDVLAALSGIALLEPLVSGKKLSEVEFSKIKESIRVAEGSDKRQQLEQLVSNITELIGIGEPATDAYQSEQVTLADLWKQFTVSLAASRGERLKRLYSAAQDLLSSDDWKDPAICPLCDSSIAVDLQASVRERLNHYSEASSKLEQVRVAWRSSAWVRRLILLEEAKPLQISDAEKLASATSRKVQSGEVSWDDIERCIRSLAKLELTLTTTLQSLKEKRTSLEKELPPSLVALTEQVENARQFRESLDEHISKRSEIASLAMRLKVRERWKAFVERSASEFSAADVALSRKKIADIDADYKAIFREIIGVHDVVPELQRADQREDLNVQLRDFHGLADVSARALLSESYRNALAISVFLSAATKHAGTPRFVVLDDVTSSFDAGNQWKLMEVIRTRVQFSRNPSGLQFIILSHDGLLEKYFDKQGNTQEWHHHRLQGWPPLGAVVSQAQDSGRLRATAVRMLDAGQVNEAGPLVRQYLEYKLLQIISKVRIPAPLDFAIKDHLKMVSNCIDVINDAVKLHKQAGNLILDAKQIQDLDTVHVPALVGNWIAHFETASGASVAPPVLKGVLQTIDDFAECFRYEDNSSGGSQKKWYKSLSARA